MDLVCIETEDTTLYSCLSIGYALMADVDIESECLRYGQVYPQYVAVESLYVCLFV